MPGGLNDPEFTKELAGFAPSMHAILKSVWTDHAAILNAGHNAGASMIYAKYAGAAGHTAYDPVAHKRTLSDYLSQLLRIANGDTPCHIYIQGLKLGQKPVFLTYDNYVDLVDNHGAILWTTFFHFIPKSRKRNTVLSRVYLNTRSSAATLEMMKAVVDLFETSEKFVYPKVTGPGTKRNDSIVCYVESREAAMDFARTVAGLTRNIRMDFPGRDKIATPEVMRQISSGIAVADEPAKIEIFEPNESMSFGAFYSRLIWYALDFGRLPGKMPVSAVDFLVSLRLHMRAMDLDPMVPGDMRGARKLEDVKTLKAIVARKFGSYKRR